MKKIESEVVSWICRAAGSVVIFRKSYILDRICHQLGYIPSLPHTLVTTTIIITGAATNAASLIGHKPLFILDRLFFSASGPWVRFPFRIIIVSYPGYINNYIYGKL